MADYLDTSQLYDWAIGWIRSNVLIATNDVMLRIWDLFREHGIEFPFPQRDLTLRNPEAVAEAFLDRPRATRETLRRADEPKRKASGT